jgi:hypothetical protein
MHRPETRSNEPQPVEGTKMMVEQIISALSAGSSTAC